MMQLFGKLGPTRLIAALAATALASALLFALVFRMGSEDKALLFSGVEMQEAAAITAQLEQAGIDFELRGDGSSIFVPRSEVLSARMMLAGEGLPSRGGVGYEIFDSADALGQTQFQQNINRLRALEGELARTIASIEGIEAARVHLVLPERQLFERERQNPSASIVLSLRRDELTQSQVRAIRNLVASAVPGLSSHQVSVIDETGRLLAAASEGDSALAEEGEARQAAAEERIRRTVSDIVDGIVGMGNSRVQVTAEFDFNRISETSERFDPEGRVARSTVSVEEESETTDGAPEGATTAAANVPDGAGGAAGANGERSTSNRTEETTNFEISRTTRTEIIEGGRLRRLAVAVAVDGITTPGAEGAEPTWAPRSAEEIAQIATLVRSAVGFSETRGDVVEVVSVRFDRPQIEAPEAEAPVLLGTSDIMRLVEVGAALIAALALVFFVVRPLIGGLVRGGAGVGAGPALEGPTTAAALASGPVATGLPDPSGGKALLPGGAAGDVGVELATVQGRVNATSVRQIAEVVQKHPDESAQIIRTWLNTAS
jgi:flagellar M-ring protein FliF